MTITPRRLAHRTEVRGVPLHVYQYEMDALIAAHSQDKVWLLGCAPRRKGVRTIRDKRGWKGFSGPLSEGAARNLTTTNGSWARVNSLAAKRAGKLNRKVRAANKKALFRGRSLTYTCLHTITGDEVKELWQSLLPLMPHQSHSVTEDDLQTGYEPEQLPQHKWERESRNWAWRPNGKRELNTLNGTAGAPLHELIEVGNYETHGDNFVSKEFQEQAQARLEHIRDWRDGLHTITRSTPLLDKVWNSEYVGPDDEDLYWHNIAALEGDREYVWEMDGKTYVTRLRPQWPLHEDIPQRPTRPVQWD